MLPSGGLTHKFREKYKTLTLTLKICIMQDNGFKELTLVLFESLF